MRKIIYRGPEQIIRHQTSAKNVYSFEPDNKWTVEALTWADYYELLSLDTSHKLFVDSEDELSQTNLRRISMFEYTVPVEIYERQREADARDAEKKLYAKDVETFKRNIMGQIASGQLEEFPADYEEAAIEYANVRKMERETAKQLKETPVEEVPVDSEPLTEDPVEPTEEPTETPQEELPTEEIPAEEPTEEPSQELPAQEEPETPTVVTPVKKGKK